MADIKWIKISSDIFEDEKILLIESMPKSDSILIIWFKLLCFAGKQNNGGVFQMSEKISYTDEMFAKIFREPLSMVRMAMKIFLQYGMLEIVNDTYTIPNWEKHQSLGTYEKKLQRDREYRAEQRAKQKDFVVRQTTTGRPTSRSTNDDGSSSVVLQKEKENKKENILSYIEGDGKKGNERKVDMSSPRAATEEHPLPIPHESIMEAYNRICVSFPQIESIDGSREQAVKVCWDKYGSIDTFEQVFALAEASAFLKGKNRRKWRADFDWMMKPDNMSKILERKYEDDATDSSFDPKDFFEISAARAFAENKGEPHL